VSLENGFNDYFSGDDRSREEQIARDLLAPPEPKWRKATSDDVGKTGIRMRARDSNANDWYEMSKGAVIESLTVLRCGPPRLEAYVCRTAAGNRLSYWYCEVLE